MRITGIFYEPLLFSLVCSVAACESLVLVLEKMRDFPTFI